jgi:hypothetical protein
MTGPTGFITHLAVGHPGVSIRPGAPTAIVGSTYPAVRYAGVRVTVKLSCFKGGSLLSGPARLVAAVRTNGEGRFRVKDWRPKAVGEYQVLASIAHPGAGLLHDSTCPTTVNVLQGR